MISEMSGKSWVWSWDGGPSAMVMLGVTSILENWKMELYKPRPTVHTYTFFKNKDIFTERQIHFYYLPKY